MGLNTGSRREKISFDSNWQFYKGDIAIPYAVKAGMTAGITDCGSIAEGDWLHIAFNDKGMNQAPKETAWKSLALPHDWCIEQNYVNDDKIGARPGSHGYLPSGIGFYRKYFTIDQTDIGQKVSISFDGIMGVSTVWVNGHLIGQNNSGYTSFSYDLTDVLRYGDEGGNLILVKVDASQAEGWWYEGCGIYRHVWLDKTDRLHVAKWGTYITTPRVTHNDAEVNIQTRILNEYSEDAKIRLITVVINPDNETIQTITNEGTAGWLCELQVEQILVVSDPKLWSVDHPYLYKAVTLIEHNGQLVDHYETAFGIRSIWFDSDEGFFLNGEKMLIKGVCVHQDFAGVGVALPDSLIAYKIKLLKNMGCNAYRSAHHPPTPELLDLCDQLGMLVMDENRKLDISADGMENLKSLLYRDRNHPSVILWSLENEEILEGTAMGARILKSMVDLTHRIDPTRLTVAAMNHGWNDGGYSAVVDMVGYNYGQRDDQDVRDKVHYPNRLMIGSESASFTTTRGIYEDDLAKGYCSSYGTNIPVWGCSPEKAWQDVAANPFLTGVFIWTGFDYRGEPTPHLWPCINSHFGIMDTCGFPKDIYYYMKAVWTEEPMVHILPHWNWLGRERETIAVWAYSNCETVELLLNGISLGVQQVVRSGHLEWKVSYEPGELTAIGRVKGVAITEKSLRTASSPHAIRLTPNRLELAADGCDVGAIRVDILDIAGEIVPYADNEVVFEVTGAGEVLGVGNGDPSSHEPDKASKRRAFNGSCLLLVQAAKQPGSIHIKATSLGLINSFIELEARSR